MSLIENEPTPVSRIKGTPGLFVRRTKELLHLDDDAPDEEEAGLRLQVTVKIMADIADGGFFTQGRKNADRRRYHLNLKGPQNKQYWVHLDYFFHGEDVNGEHNDSASLAVGDLVSSSENQRIFGTHFSDFNSKFPKVVKEFNEVRGSHMYKSPPVDTADWRMREEIPMPKFRKSERKKFLRGLLASHVDQEATEAEYAYISKTTRRHRLYWMRDVPASFPQPNLLLQR